MATAVSTGATIAFQSGFFTNNLVNATLNVSRPAIDVTHHSSSGGREFLPGKLPSGTLDVTWLYGAEDLPMSSSKVAESITVTLADATTWVFNGFMVEGSVQLPLEERQEASATIQITGSNTGVS